MRLHDHDDALDVKSDVIVKTHVVKLPPSCSLLDYSCRHLQACHYVVKY